MNKYRFSTIYWDSERSTRIKFRPLKNMPRLGAMACMVIVRMGDGKIAISRPKRGWGLPGEHIEPGETAEQGAIREVYEETAVRIKNLQVVGGWLAEKLFPSELNKNSPQKSYRLLFIADAEIVDDFTNRFEITERAFVPVDKITDYITSKSFAEVYDYLLSEKLI